MVRTDRACGLIFRAQDSDNYYVVHADALEGNVNLYHTVQRSRVQFAGTATDSTFVRGKIGLWTKADSVTAFDDLEATAQ